MTVHTVNNNDRLDYENVFHNVYRFPLGRGEESARGKVGKVGTEYYRACLLTMHATLRIQRDVR